MGTVNAAAKVTANLLAHGGCDCAMLPHIVITHSNWTHWQSNLKIPVDLMCDVVADFTLILLRAGLWPERSDFYTLVISFSLTVAA